MSFNEENMNAVYERIRNITEKAVKAAFTVGAAVVNPFYGVAAYYSLEGIKQVVELNRLEKEAERAVMQKHNEEETLLSANKNEEIKRELINRGYVEKYKLFKKSRKKFLAGFLAGIFLAGAQSLVNPYIEKSKVVYEDKNVKVEEVTTYRDAKYRTTDPIGWLTPDMVAVTYNILKDKQNHYYRIELGGYGNCMIDKNNEKVVKAWPLFSDVKSKCKEVYKKVVTSYKAD